MPRRVVLHIGLHKTGTSSVQAVLRANRAALKRHAALRLKPQIKELLHGARGYSTWRDPLSLAKTARRFDAMLSELRGMPRRVLIVSAEELSGHMPGRGDLMDYGAAPELVRVYAKAVRKRFPETELAIYAGVRGAESWLRSAYWEHVKSSSLTLDYDTFADRYAAAADFGAVLARVSERAAVEVKGGALEGFEVERLGPAAGLLAACDLPGGVIDNLTPAPAANTRLPEAVLLDLLAANRAYADRDARKEAKRAILEEAKIIRTNNLGPVEDR
ncbi:MAG: hypothetical protein AAFY38_06765 [Pseudomonadota bacterium]